MNCQEALRLLYDIIDREASEVDSREVEEHLSKCRHCSEVYRVERQVHDFILAKTKNQNPELKLENLKSKIETLLEKEDQAAPDPFASGEAPEPAASPAAITRIGRYVAAAAALVVLVWTAFTVSDLFYHRAAYYELEQQHFAAERDLTHFASADLTEVALGECTKEMRYAISPAVSEFELVGGRMEKVDGIELAHFLYQRKASGCVISVFVIPADQFHIPEDVLKHAETRGGRVFYDHHCRGCRMVYHRESNVVIITATQNHDIDLMEFVPGSSAV